MAPKNGKVTITFIKEKNTKNFIRFAEVTDGGDPITLGTLYVRPSHVPEGAQTIEVTISAKVFA